MEDKFLKEYKMLGLSIAYFRKERGYTQQQIADLMDVNYETISRIENANSGISLDLLFKLSKSLNVSLGELFSHARI